MKKTLQLKRYKNRKTYLAGGNMDFPQQYVNAAELTELMQAGYDIEYYDGTKKMPLDQYLLNVIHENEKDKIRAQGFTLKSEVKLLNRIICSGGLMEYTKRLDYGAENV